MAGAAPLPAGLQGWSLSPGRSSHPPRLVCAGAWVAGHRVVRRLQRRSQGEASGQPMCSCCARISCGVGPSRYPQELGKRKARCIAARFLTLPVEHRTCGRIGRQRVASMGTFPTTLLRTARESFDLKPLSSGRHPLGSGSCASRTLPLSHAAHLSPFAT